MTVVAEQHGYMIEIHQYVISDADDPAIFSVYFLDGVTNGIIALDKVLPPIPAKVKGHFISLLQVSGQFVVSFYQQGIAFAFLGAL